MIGRKYFLKTIFRRIQLKNKICFIGVLIIFSSMLGACSFQAEDSHPIAAAHWTYEGAEGPEHWGDEPSYATCSTGTSQSPIDISVPSEKDLKNISFHYQPSEVNILNNGHTAQVNYDAGSYIELDGARYDVAQFHYHTPSEHAIDGKLFAAEIHIVHKNADGELAVVGIMLEAGSENLAFAPFISNLPAEEAEVKDTGVTINAADFLPAVQTTFRYTGSLTTPPCTEGVHWLVMTVPVELSAAQLNSLATLFEHHNNRPVQELNDRPLAEDSTP
jgi:carbonic anhydrase